MSWRELFQYLVDCGVPLQEPYSIASINEFNESVELEVELETGAASDGSTLGLACGQYQGQAYVHDSMSTISRAFDVIAQVARRSGKMVVGGGAESVSGSYWLVVAEGNRVHRLYWQCYMELSQPLSEGDPYRCESDVSLDDIYGNGIFAVLDELGFDFGEWSRNGELFCVRHPLLMRFSEEGPLSSKINRHRADFKQEDRRISLSLQIIKTPPARKPSLWTRIKRLFGGNNR